MTHSFPRHRATSWSHNFAFRPRASAAHAHSVPHGSSPPPPPPPAPAAFTSRARSSLHLHPRALVAVKDKLSTAGSIAVVGLLLEFAQLLSGMLQISVKWGPPLSDVAAALNFMLLRDLDPLPTACEFGNGPVGLYVVETLWPLLLLLLFTAVFAIDRLSPM